MMKITKTIGVLLARATHKECFKSMLCARETQFQEVLETGKKVINGTDCDV